MINIRKQGIWFEWLLEKSRSPRFHHRPSSILSTKPDDGNVRIEPSNGRNGLFSTKRGQIAVDQNEIRPGMRHSDESLRGIGSYKRAKAGEGEHRFKTRSNPVIVIDDKNLLISRRTVHRHERGIAGSVRNFVESRVQERFLHAVEDQSFVTLNLTCLAGLKRTGSFPSRLVNEQAAKNPYNSPSCLQ